MENIFNSQNHNSISIKLVFLFSKVKVIYPRNKNRKHFRDLHLVSEVSKYTESEEKSTTPNWIQAFLFKFFSIHVEVFVAVLPHIFL